MASRVCFQTDSQKRNPDSKKNALFASWQRNSIAMLFALSLAACGGGSGGGSGGGGLTQATPGTVSSGGGGATSNAGTLSGANASLVLLTTNSSGPVLTSIGYTTAGALVAGTPPAVQFHSSATTLAPCGGTPQAGYYDKTNGVFFVEFLPSSSTVTVCSYSTSSATGAITPVNYVANSGGTGFAVDTTNKALLITCTNCNGVVVYTYASNGQISATSNNFSTGSQLPSGNYPIQADFPNGILWYGTSSSGNNTYAGACHLTFSSGNYSATSCSSISNSITVPGGNTFFVGSGDFLYNSQEPSNCSATVTNAYIDDYNTTTGNFSTTSPASQGIGTCAYVINVPGNNSSQSADLTDKLFFSQSSSALTPYAFSTSGSGSITTAVGTAKTITNQASGSSIGLDPVNHFNILLTGSGSQGSLTTVSGVTFYPYTTAGFGSSIPSSLSFTNNTYTCPSTNGNCGYGLFAILN